MRVHLVFPILRFGLTLALAVVLPSPIVAQTLLPDAEPFYAAARENLARATREQDAFSYKERRTELHLNPFGRLGAGDVLVAEFAPGDEPGVFSRRLIERNGKPVPGAAPERVNRRRRPQKRSGFDDAVDMLRFAIARRETTSGRDFIVVTFEPKPDAKPETREGRLAKVLSGTIWVDEAAREVTRVEATAVDDVSYGLGVIARLHKGATVTLTRERVTDRIWLPTSLRFTGAGRAILFRKMTLDHSIEWFDYQPVAGSR